MPLVELAGYLGQPRLPCRVLAIAAGGGHESSGGAARMKRPGRKVAYTHASVPALVAVWLVYHECPSRNLGGSGGRHRPTASAGKSNYCLKQWKSLLHIHVLAGTRPERIKCLLYGRLTTITMLMRICAYASWYAVSVLRRELSLHKLILWLKRKDRFAHAIEDSTVETLWSDLRRDMVVLLCKQKRKRRTSQQLLAGGSLSARVVHRGDNDGGPSGLA